MSTHAHSNPRQPDSARRGRNVWPSKSQGGPAEGTNPVRPAARRLPELRPRRAPRLSPEQLRDAFDWDEPDEPEPEAGDFYFEPDDQEGGPGQVF